MDTSRAELQLPPFGDVFRIPFVLPFLVYFSFFRLASHTVKTYAWQSYTGFQQYRLQNLSICFLHSCISGIWSVGFLLTHSDLMLTNVIHYYDQVAAQLPIISIAYFVHDVIDMLNYEWSRWTLELLFHHAATCLALTSGLLPHKYLLADYWALLMEGNSIFLHARTIMQISGEAVRRPGLFRKVILMNVTTFVLFRFVAQAVFVHWVVNNMDSMHLFYVCVALGGPLVFLVINCLLFFRILVSDGFLGDERRKKAAVANNRDTVQSHKENYLNISKEGVPESTNLRDRNSLIKNRDDTKSA